MSISNFNQYNVGDHVATNFYYKNSILCRIIIRISVSNQRVQIVVDGLSELRTYNFSDQFGRIEKYLNTNLINFMCVFCKFVKEMSY